MLVKIIKPEVNKSRIHWMSLMNSYIGDVVDLNNSDIHNHGHGECFHHCGYHWSTDWMVPVEEISPF